MVVYRQLSPTEQESAIARTAKQQLSHHVQTNHALTLQIAGDTQAEQIELPANAATLLLDILEVIASGGDHRGTCP